MVIGMKVPDKVPCLGSVRYGFLYLAPCTRYLALPTHVEPGGLALNA
ncbi:hypothetical protein JMJ77_0002599, partial [Colletotrichum scovillei]